MGRLGIGDTKRTNILIEETGIEIGDYSLVNWCNWDAQGTDDAEESWPILGV